MANRFFVGDTDSDWFDANNWATTTGGAGGAGIPTAGDDVKLDANSPNCTLTTTSAICSSFIATGFTNTFNMSSNDLTVDDAAVGGLGCIFVSGMTLTSPGQLTLEDLDASFDPGSKTFDDIIMSLTGATNVTLTLAGNLNCVDLVLQSDSSGLFELSAATRILTLTGNLAVTKSDSGTLRITNTTGTISKNGDGTFNIANMLPASALNNILLKNGIITFSHPDITMTGKLRFISDTSTSAVITISSNDITCTSLTWEAGPSDGTVSAEFEGGDLTFTGMEITEDSPATIIMGSGTFNLTPSASVDSFRFFDTVTPGTSTFKILNSTNAYTLSGGPFNNVTINGAINVSSNFTLDINGNFLIDADSVNGSRFTAGDDVEIGGNLTLDVSNGTDIAVFATGGNIITIKGNMTVPSDSDAQFAHASSTVIFAGTALQTISVNQSANQFNKVKITNTSSAGVEFIVRINIATLEMNASSADIRVAFTPENQKITTITLTGSGNNHNILRSITPGSRVLLTVTTAGQSVDHCDVKDWSRDNPVTINARDLSNIDSGNNFNWIFLAKKKARIVYDYQGRVATTQQILYDYRGRITGTERIVYDYIPFVPNNVRMTFDPYSQDSVRINWTGFVPPSGYVGVFFYSVYVDGEPYEVDIDSNQTWMDLVGLIEAEDVIVDVVIQTEFGQRFTFDFTDIGDRIKILFTESGDDNIARYVFFLDDDFTKEIGEIKIQDRRDILNTSFVPEGS